MSPREALGGELPGFEHIASQYEPRPMQRVCASLDIRHGGEVVVLESDTGSGKTEAALAHYLRLFHAREVDGLYFALPTRTAATQLHARLTAIFAHAFLDPDSRPPVSLAVPGYIRVDEDEGVALPHFRVLWNDDPGDELRWRGWAAEQPKRFLSGAIVVGTIDQVLLSTLQIKHAHMRYAGLSRMLLIVDEVHASDAYMTRLLDEVLTHHLALGGHALLMSATLGQAVLADYARRPHPPRADAIARAYPLVTRIPAARDAEPERIPIQPADYNKVVDLELVSLAEDQDEPLDDALIERIIDDLRAGARVLVIRNLVRECAATFTRLEEALEATQMEGCLLSTSGIAIPHHSRYADVDRRLLDTAIEAAMGKQSTRRSVIAITTQTVQQSLDLDADILYTDLCPMDVLLQRLGRCHRHPDRERPEGYERARLVCLVPEARDMSALIASRDGSGRGPHGLGTVYEDLRILEATWSELEARARLSIPAQNRELVELSLHPEVLDAIVSSGGDAWERHARYLSADSLASRVIAEQVLLDRSRPYPDTPFLSEYGEGAQKIRTRLGEDDRLARFDPPISGPLGTQIRQIKIPGHLCRGLAPDALPEDVSTTHDELSFRLGEHDYLYTRLGLTRQENDGA